MKSRYFTLIGITINKMNLLPRNLCLYFCFICIKSVLNLYLFPPRWWQWPVRSDLPERIFKFDFYAEVTLRPVFTLHAHLEHAGVTATCREGEDGKDLREKRGRKGRGEQSTSHRQTANAHSFIITLYCDWIITPVVSQNSGLTAPFAVRHLQRLERADAPPIAASWYNMHGANQCGVIARPHSNAGCACCHGYHDNWFHPETFPRSTLWHNSDSAFGHTHTQCSRLDESDYFLPHPPYDAGQIRLGGKSSY